MARTRTIGIKGHHLRGAHSKHPWCDCGVEHEGKNESDSRNLHQEHVTQVRARRAQNEKLIKLQDSVNRLFKDARIA